MGLPQGAIQAFNFQDGQGPTKEGEKPNAKPGVTYQKLNWLKAGILTTDKVLTVSPNYASEISSGVAKGVELDAFIRQAGGEWRAAVERAECLAVCLLRLHAGCMLALRVRVLSSGVGLALVYLQQVASLALVSLLVLRSLPLGHPACLPLLTAASYRALLLSLPCCAPSTTCSPRPPLPLPPQALRALSTAWTLRSGTP